MYIFDALLQHINHFPKNSEIYLIVCVVIATNRNLHSSSARLETSQGRVSAAGAVSCGHLSYTRKFMAHCHRSTRINNRGTGEYHFWVCVSCVYARVAIMLCTECTEGAIRSCAVITIFIPAMLKGVYKIGNIFHVAPIPNLLHIS